MNQIKIIEKETSQLKPFEVKTQNDLSKSVELLSKCNIYLDKLTEEKEKITKPMNEALKEVRSRYKPLTDKLESVILQLRTEQSKYQTEQVRLQRIEEEKISNRVGEGKGKLKLETAVKKISEIDIATETVATTSGVVKFREKPVLKIMDETLIPREYLIIDEARVLKDLITGKSVPGVVLEIIQIPINYR